MAKKILVAGAGKGIGRAVAELALELGHEVLAVSRTEADFSTPRVVRPEILTGGELLSVSFREITPAIKEPYTKPYLITDLAQPESLIQLAPYADKIDAVINCTGTHPGIKTFSQHQDFAGETLETIKQNVLPALNLYQVFLSAFRQKGKGHFVHISSGALDFHDPSESGYCASKAALESLVRCLQEEDKENQIKHHALRVALTDTPLARKVCPSITDSEWNNHYTARETASYLLDLVLRPENYPHPIITLPYQPVRTA